MAFIRVVTPELATDQKRFMAEKINSVLAPLMAMQAQEWLSLRFDSYKPEDFALNGKLVLDTTEPEMLVEIHGHDLSRSQKERLVQETTPLMLNLFGLGPQMAYKISVLFRDYDSGDYANGGRFSDQMREGGPGETPPRGGLRADQRGTVPAFGA